jgi:mannosyltransferase
VIEQLAQPARRIEVRAWTRVDAVGAGAGAVVSSGLAAAIGLLLLDRRDLTYDEVVSSLNLNDGVFAASFMDDRFNAFYYGILRAWSTLAGGSDLALRLPSMVAGALAAGAIYLLARRLFGSRTASLATLLLCVNSFFMRYEQAARTYTPALLLVSVAGLLLVLAVERGGALRRVGYAVAGAVAVYAHVFAAYVLAAHAAWLGLQRRLDAGWIAVLAAVGVATLPLTWALLHASHQLDWIPNTTPVAVVRMFWLLSGGVTVTPDALVLAGLSAGLVIVGGWSLVGGRRWRCAPSEAGRLIALWLFLGAGLAVLSSIARPSLIARYLIVLLPALVIVLARGLEAIPGPSLRRSVTAVVLALSIAQMSRYATGPYPDWTRAGTLLAARAAMTDAVVVVPETRILALRHAADTRMTLAGRAATDAALARVDDVDRLTDATRSAWVAFESTDSAEAREAIGRLTGLGLRPVEDLTAGTVHVIHWTRG